jgi:broad specificity phosphatase PhoE
MIVVRHAETTLNKDGKIRGWIDVPIDKLGKKEAGIISRKLSKKPIDLIITSDLKRCVQTAEIIAKDRDIKVVKSKQLRPWDLGMFAGMKAELVTPILNDLVMNDQDKKIPEGESFNAFKNRVIKAWKHLFELDKKKNILVVTHYRNIKLLKAWDKASRKTEVDKENFIKNEGLKPAKELEIK